MIWIMTMARRMNGVYAAFMLVAFMMGVAGALQAPTLSLFLSREVGAQPFWDRPLLYGECYCWDRRKPLVGKTF